MSAGMSTRLGASASSKNQSVNQSMASVQRQSVFVRDRARDRGPSYQRRPVKSTVDRARSRGADPASVTIDCQRDRGAEVVAAVQIEETGSYGISDDTHTAWRAEVIGHRGGSRGRNTKRGPAARVAQVTNQMSTVRPFRACWSQESGVRLIRAHGFWRARQVWLELGRWGRVRTVKNLRPNELMRSM